MWMQLYHSGYGLLPKFSMLWLMQHNGLFKKREHGVCGITWTILSLLELHVRESAGLIMKLCVVHVKFLESHWHLRNVKDQHVVWFFWATSLTP